MSTRVAVVVSLLAACSSSFYPRWATGYKVTSPGSKNSAPVTLVSRTDQTAAAGLEWIDVQAGGYARFVIDQICFDDLPLHFGDQQKSWLSVTLFADTNKAENGDLFTTFKTAMWTPDNRTLLETVVVMPPAQVLVRPSSCTSVSYSAGYIPLENEAATKAPRMLFIATLLSNEAYREFANRIEASTAVIAAASKELGGTDLSKIVSYTAVAAKTALQLLNLVKPEQVILWDTETLPVRPSSQAGAVQIPARTQRFAYLFTDQNNVSTGKHPDPPCPRTQDVIAKLIADGALQMRADNRLFDTKKSCAQKDTYGEPYIVWHVENVATQDVSTNYWITVTEIATQLTSPIGAGYGYDAKVRELEESVSKVAARMSSGQKALFDDVNVALRVGAQALGRMGAPIDVCAARTRIAELVDRSLDRRWGAPTSAVEKLTALRDALNCPPPRPVVTPFTPPDYSRFDAASDYRVYPDPAVPAGELRVTVQNSHPSDHVVFEVWKANEGVHFTRWEFGGGVTREERLKIFGEPVKLVWVMHHDETKPLLDPTKGWRVDFKRNW